MKSRLFALALSVLCLSYESSAQVNLTQGLLAYYPFSGNANDASGNGNHGTPMGGIQLTNDKFGNPNSAYRFDGVDDYIFVADNGNLSPKAITVTAWVYSENATAQSITGKIQKNTGFHSTFHIGINYDVQAGFFWGLAPGGSPCFQQIPYNPNNPFVTSPDFFSTNAWHCVVGTFKDSVQKLFIDGVLVKTRKNNFKDLDQCTNTNFMIGRWWDGDPIPFKGMIDEVRVYNRELNQQEINALCDSKPCNNWLKTSAQPGYVNVGDLDIPGTQLTVEAQINRTAPYSGGNLYAGDIVSKHDGPSDANYLLRPNSAEITTSNGYFRTPDVCAIDLNKTYHVAMTYDGSMLKFYRNGFLLSQVPATGTLFQNNWQTRIGFYESQIHPTQFVGFTNEVRIWNVVRTQDQIRSYMNSSLPPSGQAGLQAYYVFDNLLNKQGNPAWNATLGPNASINQLNPNCASFLPDSCAAAPLSIDFNYKQDVCNPLSVQFFSVGENLQSPYWGFSDGGSSTGNLNPIYTFPAFGNYTVKYSATNGITRDTITKIIPVNIVRDDIILTPDTTICNGASKQLRTVPSLSFCWSPTTYLNNPNSANPIASPPNDITYYFNAEVTGNNLITNGNFSAGNTGFTSQYNFTATNVTEGEYTVGTNPQLWNGGMSNCRDHTNGSGNMMIVNGAPVADVNLWSQTVTVTPNTNYAFSTWLQSVHNSNPAQLQFAINGKLVGNLFVASVPPCNWTQFYTTWNSGTNTTATISIVNKNQQIAGNDFALDDISFAPVFIKRDSVHITVEKPVVNTTSDTAFCVGGSAQLSTSGASAYAWTPATGLSNAAIANPLASPITTTKYYVTGTTTSGCTAKDSITITVHSKPLVTVTNDATVCPGAPFQLQASGGTTYSWAPATGLDNSGSANPVATNNADITYTVTVTDANTCTNTGSVKLSMRARPLFTVSPATAVCEGKSTTLTANGGDNYLWSPAGLLNNPTSRTPVATPTADTQFSVYISENACNYDTTLTVDVTINPSPDVTAQKSNDLDCSTLTANLLATGATNYSWTPATGLDDPRKPNPVASINNTTTFTVTGTNTFGCSSTDTVTVKVSNGGRPIFELPNAFTPNGDRVNNCFGIRKWAQVNQLEFTIYNRWGQRVFSTNDPAKCWDGTLNGKLQDSGTYVYVIRAKSACGEVMKKGTVLLLR